MSFLKIIPIFAKKKNITIMLPINTPAPEFSLPDQDEKIRNLSKKIILYFYPKDNTSGCTKQVCNFAKFFRISEKKALNFGGEETFKREICFGRTRSSG